jgi:hypothetical protein
VNSACDVARYLVTIRLYKTEPRCRLADIKYFIERLSYEYPQTQPHGGGYVHPNGPGYVRIGPELRKLLWGQILMAQVSQTVMAEGGGGFSVKVHAAGEDRNYDHGDGAPPPPRLDCQEHAAGNRRRCVCARVCHCMRVCVAVLWSARFAQPAALHASCAAAQFQPEAPTTYCVLPHMTVTALSTSSCY